MTNCEEQSRHTTAAQNKHIWKFIVKICEEKSRRHSTITQNKDIKNHWNFVKSGRDTTAVKFFLNKLLKCVFFPKPGFLREIRCSSFLHFLHCFCWQIRSYNNWFCGEAGVVELIKKYVVAVSHLLGPEAFFAPDLLAQLLKCHLVVTVLVVMEGLWKVRVNVVFVAPVPGKHAGGYGAFLAAFGV